MHLVPLLQFLAACGWKLQLASDRAQIGAALRLAPELCHFSSAQAEKGDAGSLFIVATPSTEAAAA